MMKLSREAFESLVNKALRSIPAEFRKHLPEIAIVIRSRPSKKLLAEMEVPENETILGLYEGTPLPERSVTDALRYPDTIFLFQRIIEEECETVRDIEEEVRVTVAHEMAHYLGIDDDKLTELGYR
ncbi:MAG: metallopeptidase family protein [Chitinispirillaceae bacterium]|jgi:predicted Zn-dependent protease with MMP-like domain|nr:metallopeptidase family protein [Chitinispirillaceae bacterium]